MVLGQAMARRGRQTVIRFPWTTATAPGFLLEITQGCNVVCRGCYKVPSNGTKPLHEIENDLETGLRLRRAQTVSLAGAEPTLHPQLPEIVAAVRRRGLRTALLTNGLLLTDELLASLKKAGLDVVMVHVDEGQQRPDLSPSPTLEEVNNLRLAITRRVAAHGIDAGLCTTIYEDTLVNVPSLIRLILESEHIGFLFASHYVDVHAVATRKPGNHGPKTGNADVIKLLQKAFGIEPFAEADPAHPLHWISYFVPVVHDAKGQSPRWIRLRSGALDSFLLSLPRWLSGKNLFYTRQSTAVTVGHVVLNRLGSGDWGTAASVLCAPARGSRIGVKRMIFDEGLKLTADGRLDCLDFCPNSTVRNGRLVPVCLSNYAEAMNFGSR